MTNDQALDSAVRALLREPAATRTGGLHRALDRVGTTPQRRRRWWPFALSDTGPRVGGSTMLSALKFIAAGVIVALFGGFLLAGVLTMQQDGEVPPAAVSASPTAQSEPDEVTEPPDPQPSPITTEELLSGMITEEVEPGVLRVLNDGVRDLPCEGWPCAVVAGQDGSIWLVRDGDDYGFDRLGSPESRTSSEGWDVVAPDGTVWRSDTRMVAPDGTDWVSDEKHERPPEGVREVTRLQALEDGSWTVRAEGPGLDEWTIAPDGTVWASYRTEDRNFVVARLGADGWEPLEDPTPASGNLVVTQGGELWVGGGWLGRYMERRDDGSWQEHEGGSLWRYREDDGAWQEVTVDALVHHPGEQRLRVGPDGTVWFAGAEPLMRDGKPVPDAFRDPTMSKPGDPFLMRFDGTEWQRWGPADGVPSLGAEATLPDLMPAPDGGLWLVESNCHEYWGVARFDVSGPTWRHFLSGHCIESMDIAPDGVVWLMTPTNDEDDTFELYVITPEAVAAKPAEVIEPTSVEETTTTAADLLSGMATEEVEPGVYRVINDGVRDLTSKNNEDIVAGHDGGVWLLRENRFLRLGTPGGHEWASKKPKVCDFEVAPDGTVWMVQEPTAKAGPAIRSYDGRQWTTVFRTKEDCNVEVAPDGTVLADHTRRDEHGGFVGVVLRLDPDIEEFEVPPPEGADPFVATRGQIWAADGWAVHGDRSFWRYGELDGAWHRVATLPQPAYSLLLDDFVYGAIVDAVGSDGTIWYAYAEPLMVDGELVLDEKDRATLGDAFLLRFDGSGWQRWATADGVPSQSAFVLTPAPDGAVWLRRNARWEPGVDGIFRFDGSTWRHHLPDHSIDSVDVATDGSVWLLSRTDDLYVITPEAMAATE